jgi:pimeloyl-ACP methyl ester carboxylesterase
MGTRADATRPTRPGGGASGAGTVRAVELQAGPDGGEVVLLLHGFPQVAACWRSQVESLAHAGFRAVAPTQRGYDPSHRPAEVEAYHARHLVADVLALADRLGAARFHLVGHDWGAAVAWQVAARHGDRLLSLTAVSVPHPLAYTAALTERGGEQASRSTYMREYRDVIGSAQRLLADDAALLRAAYDGLPPDAASRYVDVLSAPGALEAALSWYAATDAWLVRDLGEITVPTLFVWGEEDPAVGRAAAERCGDHVAGPYRFVPLPGAGHWIPELDAARFTPLLLEHLHRVA